MSLHSNNDQFLLFIEKKIFQAKIQSGHATTKQRNLITFMDMAINSASATEHLVLGKLSIINWRKNKMLSMLEPQWCNYCDKNMKRFTYRPKKAWIH